MAYTPEPKSLGDIIDEASEVPIIEFYEGLY
jgi:hypothetical protein